MTRTIGTTNRPISGPPVSIFDLVRKKEQGEKIVMVTAYDALFGSLVDRAGLGVFYLAERFPRFILETSDLEYQPSLQFRSLKSLPVTWGKEEI